MHNLPIRNKKDILSLICCNSFLTCSYSQDHFETRFEKKFFLYTSIHFEAKFSLFYTHFETKFLLFTPKN